MHKILTPIVRADGSTIKAGRSIVSGLFNMPVAIATGTRLPVKLRTYVLDCLSEEEIQSVDISDGLKERIEAKGYTHTAVCKPGKSELMTGYTQPVSFKSLNFASAINLQQMTSAYLEDLFGYWNVYELDYEKLEKQTNLTYNTALAIKGYKDYSIVRVRIQETTGKDAGTIYVLDSNDNIVVSSDIEPYADIALNVKVSFNEDTTLKVMCDNWNEASVDLTVKHSINAL